jgi:hypothetical protein
MSNNPGGEHQHSQNQTDERKHSGPNPGDHQPSRDEDKDRRHGSGGDSGGSGEGGRKGGSRSDNRGNFANDPERARKAGQKGGKS